MLDALQRLYARDLAKLHDEVVAYAEEALLWRTGGDIANSGGHLAMHLVGNLNAYIGAGLGDSGYVRDRRREFGGAPIARARLLEEIAAAAAMVASVLRGLSQQRLTAPFPIVIWDAPTPTDYTLLHLHGHLTYHLGQINYHRRLVGTLG